MWLDTHFIRWFTEVEIMKNHWNSFLSDVWNLIEHAKFNHICFQQELDFDLAGVYDQDLIETGYRTDKYFTQTWLSIYRAAYTVKEKTTLNSKAIRTCTSTILFGQHIITVISAAKTCCILRYSCLLSSWGDNAIGHNCSIVLSWHHYNDKIPLHRNHNINQISEYCAAWKSWRKSSALQLTACFDTGKSHHTANWTAL